MEKNVREIALVLINNSEGTNHLPANKQKVVYNFK